MATIRELLTTWKFDIDTAALERMDAKVGDLKKETKDFGRNIRELSSGVTDFGKKATLFATVPIAAMGFAMVKAASDAEESSAKFNTVFSDMQDDANQTAKTLGNAFGIGSIKARELLGNTGDLLSGFGFTQEKSLDLAKSVNELAVDLASFTNFVGGAEGASEALTKALLGERESVKSLGISILEEDVKKQVAINTAKGMTFETERQAKAYATLMIAQRQSKNAIGDYARTSGGLANRTRKLMADIRGLAVEFGTILIPVAQKIVSVVMDITAWFSDLNEGTKTLILVVLGLVAALGPFLIIIGSTISSILTMIALFKVLALLGVTFSASMLLIPIAIAAAVAAVALIADELHKFFTGQGSLLEEYIGSWESVSDIIGGTIDGMIQRFKDFGQAAIDFIFSPIKKLNELGGGLGGFLFETFGPEPALAGGPAIPGATPAAAVAPVGRGGRNLNVSANISMTVPEGTSEEQKKAVQTAATDAAEATFDRLMRETLEDEPDRE